MIVNLLGVFFQTISGFLPGEGPHGRPQADPLTCGQCGGKLKTVAYLHDQVAIKQVLAHLGLSPREEPKPPPALPRSCACRSMRRAGRWRRPEDRQAAKAARSRLTTPTEGCSLPPQR